MLITVETLVLTNKYLKHHENKNHYIDKNRTKKLDSNLFLLPHASNLWIFF